MEEPRLEDKITKKRARDGEREMRKKKNRM